jgi:glucosamine--fructose-6-phosphate aminotransferase (isomerizing)
VEKWACHKRNFYWLWISYYLSLSAASFFQEMTGIPSRAVPAGELYLYPQANIPDRERTMLVAISRSGGTSETVAAVQRFQRQGSGIVVVISNYPDSPLAQLGDHAILIPAGREKSVAQTRSFASMYLAVTAFTAGLENRSDLVDEMAGLPALGRRLIDNYQDTALEIGENLDIDRFYFLGSGVRYGLACEASLKMKEMTLSHSEPFHFLEFRHGPMAMVTPSSQVVGLLSETRRTHEKAVLDEMHALGARILSLGESETMVNFDSRLPEEIRNVLYLPILQLLACSRSVTKGLNPDQPMHLNAVVSLDL